VREARLKISSDAGRSGQKIWRRCQAYSALQQITHDPADLRLRRKLRPALRHTWQLIVERRLSLPTSGRYVHIIREQRGIAGDGGRDSVRTGRSINSVCRYARRWSVAPVEVWRPRSTRNRSFSEPLDPRLPIESYARSGRLTGCSVVRPVRLSRHARRSYVPERTFCRYLLFIQQKNEKPRRPRPRPWPSRSALGWPATVDRYSSHRRPTTEVWRAVLLHGCPPYSVLWAMTAQGRRHVNGLSSLWWALSNPLRCLPVICNSLRSIRLSFVRPCSLVLHGIKTSDDNVPSVEIGRWIAGKWQTAGLVDYSARELHFLARDVIYTSRAYAMMPVRLSVCLWRKCIDEL